MYLEGTVQWLGEVPLLKERKGLDSHTLDVGLSYTRRRGLLTREGFPGLYFLLSQVYKYGTARYSKGRCDDKASRTV